MNVYAFSMFLVGILSYSFWRVGCSLQDRPNMRKEFFVIEVRKSFTDNHRAITIIDDRCINITDGYTLFGICTKILDDNITNFVSKSGRIALSREFTVFEDFGAVTKYYEIMSDKSQYGAVSSCCYLTKISELTEERAIDQIRKRSGIFISSSEPSFRPSSNDPYVFEIDENEEELEALL